MGIEGKREEKRERKRGVWFDYPPPPKLAKTEKEKKKRKPNKMVVLFIYLIPICAPPLAAVKSSWAKIELAK